jgi:hypothetical protein
MSPRTCALALLVACKAGDPATPSPPRAVASVAPAPGVTAAPALPIDAGAAAVDAAAAWSTRISAAGVGPITASTDPAAVASLLVGLTATTAHHETEDSSRDDTTLASARGPELVVVVENVRDPQAIFRVDVVGPMFATERGVRVGSSVADLVAAYPDATCTRAHYDPNPEGFDEALFCSAASLPNVGFFLDPAARRLRDGKVAIARIKALRFRRILWRRPDPADRAK